MVLHRKVAHPRPGAWIGKDIPLGAFAVELDQIDRAESRDRFVHSDLASHAVGAFTRNRVERVLSKVEIHASLRRADCRNTVPGIHRCTVRSKAGFQGVIRLVALDAGARKTPACGQREEAEVRADIEHRCDGTGNAGEPITVEIDEVDELEGLHAFLAVWKTNPHFASADLDRADVDLLSGQAEDAVSRQLKPPLHGL